MFFTSSDLLLLFSSWNFFSCLYFLSRFSSQLVSPNPRLPFRMEVLNFFFSFFFCWNYSNHLKLYSANFRKISNLSHGDFIYFFLSRSAKSTILQHARYLLKTCTTSTFLRLSSPWKSRNNRLFFFRLPIQHKKWLRSLFLAFAQPN